HKAIRTDAWVRATADKASPLVVHVKVASRGAHHLRFDAAPELVRVGDTVELKCEVVGYESPISAVFELCNAEDPGFSDSDPHHADDHPDKDPDRKGAKFPDRVLGIKQRLQLLGYYYETFSDDPKWGNRQTRVFRKCFKWYWRHVNPKSKGKAVPIKDDP